MRSGTSGGQPTGLVCVRQCALCGQARWCFVKATCKLQMGASRAACSVPCKDRVGKGCSNQLSAEARSSTDKRERMGGCLVPWNIVQNQMLISSKWSSMQEEARTIPAHSAFLPAVHP